MTDKHVTIIRRDARVYVAGKSRIMQQANTELPSYVRAVQWYGEASPPYGEVEFELDESGRQFPNVKFTDFTPIKFLFDDYVIEEEKEKTSGVKP